MNQPYPTMPVPNGYPNPYLPYAPAQPRLAHYEIIKVSGRNGAEAFEMGPNSTILLLDTTAPIVWYKETDGAGYPKLVPYQIAQIPEQEPEKPLSAKSFEETMTIFENNLTARMEEILNGKSNSDSNRAKQSRSSNKDGADS